MFSQSTKLSGFFAAALITTALAAPAPAPQAINNPVPATRASQCVFRGGPIHIEWSVYVVNTTMPSNQGSESWGGGLLDNINGEQACAPTSWQAQLDNANPQGVEATFNTPLRCSVNDISNAIHAAFTEGNDLKFGPGQWVYCQGDTLTEMFDATEASWRK